MEAGLGRRWIKTQMGKNGVWAGQEAGAGGGGEGEVRGPHAATAG